MTDWFRSWHGAPTDSKWLLIARNAGTSPAIVSAVAWALFDHASQEANRGCVATFDQETYAVWAGISDEQVAAIVNAMVDKDIIVDDRLSAWEKRQPKREDDSAQRVKAFRERTIKEETHRNADVTHRNAPEKRQKQIQSTDTEPEGDAAAARATGVDLSLVEIQVIEYIRQVPGMAAVEDTEIVEHLRDVLSVHDPPPSQKSVMVDAIRFRDHWTEKRSNAPDGERWKGWKQGITNWFSRTKEDTPQRGSPKADPNQRTHDNYAKNFAAAQKAGLR